MDKEPALEELLSKVTDPKKRTYLDLLSKIHYSSQVTREMGIAHGLPFNWRVEDKSFSDAYDAIKKQEDDYWLHFHLDNIRTITGDSTTPPQTRLLGSFFEVKKLDPSYRDNAQEARIVGDITVHLAIPPYDEGLRLLPGPTITVEAKEIPERAESGQVDTQNPP